MEHRPRGEIVFALGGHGYANVGHEPFCHILPEKLCPEKLLNVYALVIVGYLLAAVECVLFEQQPRGKIVGQPRDIALSAAEYLLAAAHLAVYLVAHREQCIRKPCAADGAYLHAHGAVAHEPIHLGGAAVGE